MRKYVQKPTSRDQATMIRKLESQLVEAQEDTDDISTCNAAWFEKQQEWEAEREEQATNAFELEKLLTQSATNKEEARKRREKGIQEQKARLNALREDHHRKETLLGGREQALADGIEQAKRSLDNDIASVDAGIGQMEKWLEQLTMINKLAC